jgi:hypothetical protein
MDEVLLEPGRPCGIEFDRAGSGYQTFTVRQDHPDL